MISLKIKNNRGQNLILKDTMKYKVNQIKKQPKGIKYISYMKDYARKRQGMEKNRL